ncbi:hypothetical protein M3Y99_01735900 [Aphelenchoides fujianensis]|nr:hypothetical protein M3Y99_01735900 [Aphelenchoides fujianensis]
MHWLSLQVFFLLLTVGRSAIFNRYHPLKGENISTKSSHLHIELLASSNVSGAMKKTAVEATRRFFHGDWKPTGDDSELIGEAMEQRFGGRWMVGIFAESDAAFTIVRRSPNYLLFRVNKRVLLIARESAHPKIHNSSLLK